MSLSGDTSGSGGSIFSEKEYRKKNKDVDKAIKDGKVKDGKEHFDKFGKFEDRSPCAFFDASKYRLENADVDVAIKEGKITSAYDHMIKVGQFEGRSLGGGIFDLKKYAEANPDVKEAASKGQIGLLDHAIKFGSKEGRDVIPGFDEKFYASNSKVKEAIDKGEASSGLEYFLTTGAAEGDSPNPYFDAETYAKENPDVKKAIDEGQVSDAFSHFAENGMKENRKFNKEIDTDYFLSQNTDVAEAVKSGKTTLFQHLTSFAFTEKRTFSRTFSWSVYESVNSSVKTSIQKGEFKNAFEHYIKKGKKQGLVASTEYEGATDKDGLIKIALDASKTGGKGGKQIIIGDEKDASIQGDSKKDNVLIGGSGSNTIVGANTDDVIIGGSKNNILVGGDGNDVLYSGSGKAILFGGNGGDVLIGAKGETTFYAGGSADTIVGGAGKDVIIITNNLKSGKASDSLSGGGKDSLGGSDSLGGKDSLGGGTDTLTGTDTVKGSGDIIYNFDAKKDVIQFADFGFGDSSEVLDAITASGQSETGKYFTVFELSESFQLTVFSEGKLTEKNCLVGTGGLIGSNAASKLDVLDLDDDGKFKGLPPGIAKQFAQGKRDELPPGLAGLG